MISDMNKDLGSKAMAKDLDPKAKAKVSRCLGQWQKSALAMIMHSVNFANTNDSKSLSDIFA